MQICFDCSQSFKLQLLDVNSLDELGHKKLVSRLLSIYKTKQYEEPLHKKLTLDTSDKNLNGDE